MPSVLNEQTQFVDVAGKPLVGGFAYFGEQGADPKLNPITIFSNRELSIPIANPQALDDFGRTTNKVWVPGRYSIKIEDLNNVQKYQELDNGETTSSGITSIDNVTGANDIIAEAATTITAYIDQQLYVLRISQVNTDAVTLNIDGVGQTPVVKNHNKPIQPGNFEADQNVIFSYNATDDVFEWANQNIKSLSSYKGAEIASAEKITIPDDGNYFELTGSVDVLTIDVPEGRAFVLKCVDGVTFLNGVSIISEDGENAVILAGGVAMFQSTDVDKSQITKIPVIIPEPESLLYHETQASGVAGTTYAAGAWRTVTLNAEVYDTGDNGSLSSNVITLDAGTYKVIAYYPLYSNSAAWQATLRFRNTSDSLTVCVSNRLAGAVDNGSATTIIGRFTIATAKDFELQTYPLTGLINATGNATDGDTETYGWVQLEKE